MKITFQEIRIIATGPCIPNQLRDVNTICRRSWYIAVHIWKIYDFKIEVVPFIINFSTDCSNCSDFLKRHLHLRNRLLDQCYQKIRLIRSHSANLELLIEKTSSIYLYVKLKALASWIFLSFTSFWRNSDSYEYKKQFTKLSVIDTMAHNLLC
jgi:hypothetical protein